jgi:hypothetical protein
LKIWKPEGGAARRGTPAGRDEAKIDFGPPFESLEITDEILIDNFLG